MFTSPQTRFTLTVLPARDEASTESGVNGSRDLSLTGSEPSSTLSSMSAWKWIWMSSLTAMVGSKRKRKFASDWLFPAGAPMYGPLKSWFPVGSAPTPRFMLLKNSPRMRR